MTANSEKTSDEAQSVIPLLTVSKDLSQLREMEEARDADLQMQAIAIEEVQKQEKEERKRKAEAVEKSLPLEKLALQASRKKAIQSMGDVVLRQQATITALSSESQKLCEFEDEDLKDEMKDKLAAVDQAIEALSQEISKYEGQWEKKEQEGTTTADEMAELRGEIAVVLKEFHSKNEAAKKVKNKIQDVRIWMAKTKKSINEREKAAAKTAAGKKMGKLAASMPLEALAEKLAKELKDESSFGSADYSLSNKQFLEKLAPIAFDLARTKSLCETVVTLEYYKLQQTWVLEKMKASASNSCCAVISKKAVAKRLRDMVAKSFPEADGEVQGGDALRGLPSEVFDMFSLQFGQRLAKTASLYSRTDMNCPTLLICLEGQLTVGGVPSKHLGAATVTELPKKLEGMKGKDLADLVKKGGWMVQLQAQGSLLVPPDTCWFEIASENNVHSLRMLVARDSMAGPMKEFLEKMNSEGNIQDGDAYFKMLAWLRGAAAAA